MDDPWKIILIAIGGSLPGLFAAVIAYLQSRTNTQKIQVTGDKVQELHLVINSRMDQLLKLTAQSEYAKGALEGGKTEKVELKEEEKTAQGEKGKP